MLKSFPIPDVESIGWIPVQSARTTAAKAAVAPDATPHEKSKELREYLAKDEVESPLFIQFDHIKVGATRGLCSRLLFVSAYTYAPTSVVGLCHDQSRYLDC